MKPRESALLVCSLEAVLSLAVKPDDDWVTQSTRGGSHGDSVSYLFDELAAE